MEINGVQGKQFVIIKSWQALLTLVLWLVLTVWLFAMVRADTTSNGQQIQELKQNKADQKEVEMLREEILRRLQRIEDKLDYDRSLRGLH